MELTLHRVPPGYLVAFAAACYGYCILPTYPSDLATIPFDRSGTTRIGRFVINHSFILPGLIGVISSCIAGYFIAGARGLVRVRPRRTASRASAYPIEPSRRGR